MADDIKQLNEAYLNLKESSGADCFFYEKEPGKWFYDIQDYPYGANERYTTNGPFRDFRAALAHLDNHYQNPGGYGIKALPCTHHEPFSPKGYTQKFCAKCGKFLGEAEDFPEPPKYGDMFHHPAFGLLTFLRMTDDDPGNTSNAFFRDRKGERVMVTMTDKRLKRAPNGY